MIYENKFIPEPEPPPEPKRKLTRAECGALGGKKTAERGLEYYQKIGRKGGNHTKMWHGVDGFYSEMGKKGGAKVQEQIAAGRRNPNYFSRIGKKGGKVIRAACREYAKRRKEEAAAAKAHAS